MDKIAYKQIGKNLECFKEKYEQQDFIYKFLECIGNSNTLVDRYRNRRSIVTRFEGLLIKKKLAYRFCAVEKMSSELEGLKKDPLVIKNKAAILMVSDGNTVLAYDLSADESYENKINKLYTDYSFFSPLWGVLKYRAIEESAADVKAAEKMAKIHDQIRRYNDIATDDDIHDLNIFMTRLLFCFFAEDTGIFEEKLFTDSIVRYTKKDGSDLAEYLSMSFEVMDMLTRDPNVINSIYLHFPYVNGGLFHKYIKVPEMGFKVRKLIIECGDLNWGEINPDIFGSMIQAVVTPGLRGTLGIHYTSVPNIMKVIGPLFLNELKDEYYNLNRQHEELKNKFEIGEYTQKEYTQKCNPIIKKCRQLLIRMSRMKFFDPACGSGNFLIITYKQLRMLEIKILKLIVRGSSSQESLKFVDGSLINISQFYGIELDDFAHETAILSLWLAEHQMNRLFTTNFKVNIQALPLKTNMLIIQGNACRLDWEDVCPHIVEEEVFIMGNPPYLGNKLQNKEQKEDMKIALHGLKAYKSLDYIAAWFWKGAQYIKGDHTKVAFVSTNSICQGEQVAMLWKPILALGIVIPLAYKSFVWSNNAKNNAGVICIIVGMSRDYTGNRFLFSSDNKYSTVKTINPYLLSGQTVFIKKKSNSISNFPSLNFGSMPNDGGYLILSTDEKNKLLQENVNSKKFIKKLFGSLEFIQGKDRYCLWITETNKNEAEKIDFIKERLDKVKTYRQKSKRKTTQNLVDKYYRFGEVRYNEKIQIIIPSVSSERRDYIPIGFLGTDSVISNSAFAIYDAKIWLFGVLTSKMHMAWVKYVGGRLKKDYRYSAQLCYNTFPFPEISKEKEDQVAKAAEHILDVRDYYVGDTMATLYDPNKMPEDLRHAHHELDLMVESCYQKQLFNTDEERMKCLFNLYEKMTKENRV